MGSLFYFSGMNWKLKEWKDLSPDELHRAYKLRTDVFVVEQGCAYPEVDDHDPHCKHLFAWEGQELRAYARICPPGTVYPEASIGRIVIPLAHRGGGFGKELVNRALEDLEQDFPEYPIKLQAQQYLEGFYASFGFKTITTSYPDVMVMHVDMIKAPLK